MQIILLGCTSGCKLSDEIYKIKWFDGPLVLAHDGGQIDEQVTVDETTVLCSPSSD